MIANRNIPTYGFVNKNKRDVAIFSVWNRKKDKKQIMKS